MRFRKKKAGSAPGTLVHVGERHVDAVRVVAHQYSKQSTSTSDIESLDEYLQGFQQQEKESGVVWLNVDGLHDVEIFSGLGKYFGIHSLVLEDCLNTTQRPKLDEYEDYLFIVLKMMYLAPQTGALEKEQVSLILKEGVVLSFQERPGDIFAPIRERVQNSQSKIRKRRADFLAYALVDAVIDNYFIVVEHLNERVEVLDDAVINNPTPSVLQDIYHMKRELVEIRKGIAPLREVVAKLLRSDSEVLEESTERYFSDVLDHLLQVLESIDALREILSGLIDLYLTSVSFRTNEIMKVLTIMAALFIPITFVAGVYGMNFEFIPELKWRYGYYYFWGLITFVTAAMLFHFRRKKWL